MHAMRKRSVETFCKLQRQAGLTDTTRTGHCQQADILIQEEPLGCLDLAGAGRVRELSVNRSSHSVIAVANAKSCSSTRPFAVHSGARTLIFALEPREFKRPRPMRTSSMTRCVGPYSNYS
jgi:hypothetical protein